MNTLDAIRARRSIRRYLPDPIPRDHLETILSAGMMAPSACNRRPWEFVVVQSREVLAALMEAQPYAGMLKTAPAAIVICGLPAVQEGICEGFWPQDCAAAVENMLLAALELGYGTCWCGVYPAKGRAEKVREVLGVESVPQAIVALGRADETPEARGFFDPGKVKYL